MIQTTRQTAPKIDAFEMALLLAEGQSGNASSNWESFIDTLSRITDSFAQSRAFKSVETVQEDALIPA